MGPCQLSLAIDIGLGGAGQANLLLRQQSGLRTKISPGSGFALNRLVSYIFNFPSFRYLHECQVPSTKISKFLFHYVIKMQIAVVTIQC